MYACCIMHTLCLLKTPSLRRLSCQAGHEKAVNARPSAFFGSLHGKNGSRTDGWQSERPWFCCMALPRKVYLLVLLCVSLIDSNVKSFLAVACIGWIMMTSSGSTFGKYDEFHARQTNVACQISKKQLSTLRSEQRKRFYQQEAPWM